MNYIIERPYATDTMMFKDIESATAESWTLDPHTKVLCIIGDVAKVRT